MNKRSAITLALSLSLFLFRVKRDETNTDRDLVPFIVGIVIFCDRGYHRVPMESNIRSNWEEASPLVWDDRDGFIYAVLWVVSHILYPCDQVRLYL
jgi:hypothetical protein